MEQRSVVVVSARRTPIGKFMGAFAEVPAVDLGVTAARAALDDAGLDPGEIQETVAGHGRQAGNGPNPGRQVSVRAGVPETVPAYTVNKACGSSTKALTLAAGSIILGEIDVALVVGMENMTRTPYLLRHLRGGLRMGDAPIEDGMSSDGFMDPLAGEAMGETAENLAERYKVTREEQDQFALQSQRRAVAAWERGRLADEVIPVDTFDARSRTFTVERDEHLRPGTTLERLARLAPVFRDPGTVTAGNSSGICDGAAALVLMAEEAARARGVRPLARIAGWASAGVDPHIMGWGVVPSTQRGLAARSRRGSRTSCRVREADRAAAARRPTSGGAHMVTAIVLITCEVDRTSETAEALADLDGISEVYSVAGDWDLVAVVRVGSHDDLAEMVTDHVRKTRGVAATQTLIAFRTYSRHDLDRMFSVGFEAAGQPD